MQRAFIEKAGFPLVPGCINYSHVPILASSNNEKKKFQAGKYNHQRKVPRR